MKALAPTVDQEVEKNKKGKRQETGKQPLR
jgi:hypothetical protein